MRKNRQTSVNIYCENYVVCYVICTFCSLSQKVVQKKKEKKKSSRHNLPSHLVIRMRVEPIPMLKLRSWRFNYKNALHKIISLSK